MIFVHFKILGFKRSKDDTVPKIYHHYQIRVFHVDNPTNELGCIKHRNNMNFLTNLAFRNNFYFLGSYLSREPNIWFEARGSRREL